MRLEGIKVKKRKELAWRYADPEKDKTVFGEKIDKSYIVFVKIKDCPQYEKEGKRYYKTKGVKHFPITGHGGTNYAYSPWKKRRSRRGVYFDGDWHNEYYQCTVYFAYNGFVYSGSIKQEINKENTKYYQRQQNSIAQVENKK